MAQAHFAQQCSGEMSNWRLRCLARTCLNRSALDPALDHFLYRLQVHQSPIVCSQFCPHRSDGRRRARTATRRARGTRSSSCCATTQRCSRAPVRWVRQTCCVCLC